MYSPAQITATPFLRDDVGVDASRGDVAALRHGDVEEAFVVSQIEVCFCTVFGDVDFSVLEGIHSTWVNVQVWIQFLHSDGEATGNEKLPQASGGQAFSEGRDDATGNDDVLACAFGVFAIQHENSRMLSVPPTGNTFFLRDFRLAWKSYAGHIPLVSSASRTTVLA